ncbi:MAG: MoaD/ThiS family protein, partial [Acidimicrobiales bacterium]
MSVEVRLPTVLRPAAGGQSVVSVEGATIGEVLSGLQAAFPGIEGQLLTEDGSLHRFVNVYVNDDYVRYMDRLDKKVADGDVVSILTAVAVGAGEASSGGAN